MRGILLAGIAIASAAASMHGGTAPADLSKPLRRTFRAGDESRYRVRLVVRSELEGPETVKIGAVTYVKTEQHSAEGRLGWTVSERVMRLGEDGGADIREQLESFDVPRLTQESGPDDVQSTRLSDSLRPMLSAWAKSRALEFRITPNGSAMELGADSAPQTDEPAPPLLTLWLAHALRPTTTLPD